MQKSERHLVVAIIVLIAGMLLVLLPLYVRADNARDWQNLPKDTNLIFGYYNNVHTNTSLDGNLPADGASVDADVVVLSYAH